MKILFFSVNYKIKKKKKYKVLGMHLSKKFFDGKKFFSAHFFLKRNDQPVGQ